MASKFYIERNCFAMPDLKKLSNRLLLLDKLMNEKRTTAARHPFFPSLSNRHTHIQAEWFGKGVKRVNK